jgi:tetratricopeptide (TPR) repeat protein
LGTGGYGPYVPREADRDLDDAISGGQRLVAVAGAPLAGRTRTLAEGALRHLPGSCLVWFEDVPGARLANLLTEARRLGHGGPVVLWLENADLALLSQFSADLLDALPHGFRIFMTLDFALLDGGVLPGKASEALNAPGTCVRLGLITDEERTRLAAEPAYAQIAAAHKDEPVLMGRLMVSLGRITGTLQTSDEDAVCRVAVLHVAVDWQRAAVPEALTRAVIEKLYRKGYWRQQAARGRGAAVSRSRFRRAIKQLLAPAPGHGLRLMEEVYFGRVTHLRPHQLLPVVADSPQRPPGWAISETLWKYLAKTLNDSQRLTVGLSAGIRGDYRHALALLDPLDPATIPAGAVVLIALAAHRAGETMAARRWYVKAIGTGHPDVAARAMIWLGSLEEGLGHIEEARAWYIKAFDTGHIDMAPEAMFSLGNVERKLGHSKEAVGWFTKAVGTGHTEAAPKAMVSLGALENELGHTDEAVGWYIKAADTGHTDMAPRAMFDLGLLEEQLGHIGQTRKWWQEAADTGHTEIAPMAMYNLGHLEQGLGHIEEAREWYAKVIKSDHADVAPQAMVNLGNLDRDQGRAAEASALYSRAIGTGHAYAAATAMLNFGVLEEKFGHIGQARKWWQEAVDTELPETAPRAMYSLGFLEQQLGHIEEAREWYAKVIESDHWEMAPRAQEHLEELRRIRDDLQRAKNFAQYGAPYIDADFDKHLTATEGTTVLPEDDEDVSS